MSVGRAEITKVTTNGPFSYTWIVDQVGTKADVSLANAGAAIDAIKPLATAMTGTITRVVVQVFTDS